MDTIKAIKTRRSIRIFDSKDVKEEPIMCIIDAARWAPSGGNRQPWEFIVITRPEARKAIASLYVEAYEREATDHPSSADKIKLMLPVLRGQLETPPYIIIVCADPNKSHSYIVDTSAAIQNMLLAAWSLGLGSAWVDLSSTLLGQYFDKNKLKNWLEIPDEIELMAIVPVGYPKGKPAQPARRVLKEIIHKGCY